MDLKDILGKIEEASKEFYREKEVSVGKIKVTIGILGADEEAAVQDFLANDTKLSYVYKMKLETVVRSIKAIDGFRVDSLDVIDTPEEIDGKPVKVEKHKYFRDIIGKWGQSVVDRLFFAYAELVAELEREINPDKTEEQIINELIAQADVLENMEDSEDGEA